MNILGYLRDDWCVRLPNHLRYNHYHGMSRPSYQLLCVLYYTIKLLVVLLTTGVIAACWYFVLGVGAVLCFFFDRKDDEAVDR